MAKRKKRIVTTKKRKDGEDKDDDFEEPAAKKIAVSSTSLLEDESSTDSGSPFNVEGVNIANSSAGTGIGFSSHFWCNYCEFSSDSKKELVTHMRQHMSKCTHCAFSSLSKAEIAKHEKAEHAEESDMASCEVDSSSSSAEHDMDKDPCSACIFCDFMTYSTEHLENHTKTKHQGILPKSVAKMISKQISARVRRADAMFYGAISSDIGDKSATEVESGNNGPSCSDYKDPITIEADPDKEVHVKTEKGVTASQPSDMSDQKLDVKSTPILPQTDSSHKSKSSAEGWKVKVETLYCLSCPYSNVAIDKLKCHSLTQHPEKAAATTFHSEGANRLEDVTFFCVKERCSYSSAQCTDYENHIINCCQKDSLMPCELEKLGATVEFIFNFQKKEGINVSKVFYDFGVQYYNPPSDSNVETKKVSCIPSQGTQVTDAKPLSANGNYPLNETTLNQAPTPFIQNVQSVSNTYSNPMTFQNLSTSENYAAHGHNPQGNQFQANNSSMNIGASAPITASQMPIGHQASATQQPVVNNQQFQQSINQPGSRGYEFHPNQNSNATDQQTFNNNANNMFNQSSADFVNSSNPVSSVNHNMFSHPVQNAPQSHQPQVHHSVGPNHSNHVGVQQQTHHQSLAAANDQCSMNASISYPEVSQPKMIDLLNDTHSILMDDLEPPSWPTQLAVTTQVPLQPPLPAPSPSLRTPPLPQDNLQSFAPNQSHNNQVFPIPSFASHNVTPSEPASIQTNSQMCQSQSVSPASVQPSCESNQSQSVPSTVSAITQYQQASQMNNSQTLPLPSSTQNSMPLATSVTLSQPALPPQTPSLQDEPFVTDLTGDSNSPQNSAHGFNDYPAASIGMGNSFGSNATNSLTPKTPADVPNFLVSSSNNSNANSSLSSSEQNDSFLGPSAPQPATSHLSVPHTQLSTPPSKHPLPGQDNHSQGIYSNNNASGTQMLPQGLPNHPQMGMQGLRHPTNSNMGFPSPNVRQRLFASMPSRPRGRPRGQSQRMVRPPSKPADDDVIVTAVVRGTMPQRPPMSQRPPLQRPPIVQRGRGRVSPMRGRGGYPQPPQRGRGAYSMSPRGRGGAPSPRGMVHRGGRGGGPANGQSPLKRPIDVSGHYVDLACAVNANEGEADEIQIVSVTPGKSGPPPKSVSASEFSYCCVHCGEDQGSIQTMKVHIKAKHNQSLLGALRNMQTGQWLYFCPKLNCAFKTYDDIRLTDHFFTCYNYDRSKPLPIDMQSALKNIKSLKIRHVQSSPGGRQGHPAGSVGENQGLRDTFNNNLKDAFGDMVENSMGRQPNRPNQIPRHPPPPIQNQPGHIPNRRGSPRWPYAPRGQPPLNPRQFYPGPRFGPRNPMLPGGPRQPRNPNASVRGRPRASSYQTSPGRGNLPPMRGQLPTIRSGAPRQNPAPGTLGNEQMPIVIDLDDDDMPDVPMSSNPAIIETESSTAIEASTGASLSTESNLKDTCSALTISNVSSESTAIPNQSTNTYEASPLPSPALPEVPFSTSSDTNTNQVSAGQLQRDLQALSALVSSHLPNEIQCPVTTSVSPTTSQPYETGIVSVSRGSSQVTQSPVPSPALSVPLVTPIPVPDHDSSSSSVSGPPPALSSQVPTAVTENSAPSASATAIRDIPSPTQLMAEMTALSKRSIEKPASLAEGENHPQASVSQEMPSPPDHSESNEDSEEERVNTILLDKVFAKVPHMPKKLSQRLVLKFKKYAADRGMIITPHSKVIDEFVSKISYKGSHAAPTPIPETRPASADVSALPPSKSCITDTKTTNLSSLNQPPSPDPVTTAATLPTTLNPTSTALPTDTTSNENPCPTSMHPASTSSPSMTTSATDQPSAEAVPDEAETDSSCVDNEVSENSNSDVIATKVIVPETKLEFSGTFASIIKAKVSSAEASPQSVGELETPVESASFLSKPLAALSPPRVEEPSSRPVENYRVVAMQAGQNDVVEKVLKKEIPMSFPSGSKEDSIEITSSVDILVSGHASLEVDIAGKPLSAKDLTEKVKDSTSDLNGKGTVEPFQSSNTKELSSSNTEKPPVVDVSSGKLIMKIRKNNIPRIPFTNNKPDEIISENESSKNFEHNINKPEEEDLSVRRSERRRKVVKMDYNPDEFSDLSDSGDDEEYHMDESDESYDGSDSDSVSKKKVKKMKAPSDPTAFDLTTKGSFGCWVCSKAFSRVMYIKRHIVAKHKCGFCAILHSDVESPVAEQHVFLFCPRNCKYVTLDSEAFSSHLDSCEQQPLQFDGDERNYIAVQKEFFAEDYPLLVEGISSGTISTKAPPKKLSLSTRKKRFGKIPQSKHEAPGKPLACSKPPDSVTITTSAIIHPPSRTAFPLESPQGDGSAPFYDDGDGAQKFPTPVDNLPDQYNI